MDPYGTIKTTNKEFTTEIVHNQDFYLPTYIRTKLVRVCSKRTMPFVIGSNIDLL